MLGQVRVGGHFGGAADAGVRLGAPQCVVQLPKHGGARRALECGRERVLFVVADDRGSPGRHAGGGLIPPAPARGEAAGGRDDDE